MSRQAGVHDILVVDDHMLVRHGVRMLLEQEEDLRCSGEASDGRSAIAMVTRCRPDLVLLDLGLPDLDGLQIIRTMLGVLPELKIVALTASLDRTLIERVLAAGAHAYLVKQGSGDELLATIRSVLADVSGIRPTAMEVPAAVRPEHAARLAMLTEREVEIVKLIARGNQNAEIADILSISVLTVRKHRQNLMAKLGLRNAAELANFAIEHGLVLLQV